MRPWRYSVYACPSLFNISNLPTRLPFDVCLRESDEEQE